MKPRKKETQRTYWQWSFQGGISNWWHSDKNSYTYGTQKETYRDFLDLFFVYLPYRDLKIKFFHLLSHSPHACHSRGWDKAEATRLTLNPGCSYWFLCRLPRRVRLSRRLLWKQEELKPRHSETQANPKHLNHSTGMSGGHSLKCDAHRQKSVLSKSYWLFCERKKKKDKILNFNAIDYRETREYGCQL